MKSDDEARYQELLREAKRLMPSLAGDHVYLDRMIEASRERQGAHISRLVHRNDRIWDEHDHARNGSSKERPLYVMYLDESGEHELERLSPTYPVFVLCGIILRDGYPTRKVGRAIGRIKDCHLCNDEVPLHWFNITSKNKDFSMLGDAPRNTAFHSELDALRRDPDYRIIAAAINKDDFLKEYRSNPIDSFLPGSPYAICLDFVVERFLHFLWNHEQSKGKLIAESRGERENSELQLEFLRLGLCGTQYVSEKWVRYHLRPVIRFRRKEECVAGLELADIVAGPIGSKCLDRGGVPLGWDSLKHQFYDGEQGRPESYGLKVFPEPAAGDMFK